MAIVTIDEAKTAFLAIPAIASLYDSAHEAFITKLLEDCSITVDGVKKYRIYAVAAAYIRTHPDFMIKKHDRTELADPIALADYFLELQTKEDGVEGVTPPAVTSDREFPTFSMLRPVHNWTKK
ncbi:MAG: hypothetical protein F6K47_04510 [Symploca sp. SIO2E6]|nr:hypothetical protein [Symploca sp. SIO2E6]